MTIELNEDQISNRVNWVKDLLSGQFKQGHGCLKRISGSGEATYCCLGVPCERLQLLDDIKQAPDYSITKTHPTRSQGFLNYDNLELLGISNEDQHLAGRWNDNFKYTFARIADFIAFATENRLLFADVDIELATEGYALAWLESK